MSKHLTQAPTTIQFLVGVAIAATMRTGVEEFVQGRDAPNLHAALVSLPKPLADPEKAIQNDQDVLLRAARLLDKQVDSKMKASEDGVRVLAKRLDRDLAALQCIEAIRSYATSHGGRLPQVLTEITGVAVPTDPVGGGAFHYTLTGSTAVLESVAPTGEKADMLRYEITVKK